MAARRNGKIKILPHMHLKVSEIPSHPCETDPELSSGRTKYSTKISTHAKSNGASVTYVDQYVTRICHSEGEHYLPDTHTKVNKARNNRTRHQPRTTNTESPTNLIHVDSTELNKTRLENSGRQIHKQSPKIPVRSSKTVLQTTEKQKSVTSSDSDHSSSSSQYQPHHLYNLLHNSENVSRTQKFAAAVDADQRNVSSPIKDKSTSSIHKKGSTQLNYSSSRRKLPEVPVRTSSLRNLSLSNSNSPIQKQDISVESRKQTNNMIDNTPEKLSVEFHENEITDSRNITGAYENQLTDFEINIKTMENNNTYTELSKNVNNSDTAFNVIDQSEEGEVENDALKSFSDFLKRRTNYKHSEFQDNYLYGESTDTNITYSEKDDTRSVTSGLSERLDYEPADELLKEVNDLLSSAEKVGKNLVHVTDTYSPIGQGVDDASNSELTDHDRSIGSEFRGINIATLHGEDIVMRSEVNKLLKSNEQPTLPSHSDTADVLHLAGEPVVDINKGICDSESHCDVMINKLLSATHEVNDIVNNVDSRHSDSAKYPEIVTESEKSSAQQSRCVSKDGYKDNGEVTSDNETVDKAGEKSSSLAEVSEITVENLMPVVVVSSVEHKSHKTTQVLRTPSYRKRVMAKARNKYGSSFKKTSECSCQARDSNLSDTSDDKNMCTFCELNRNFTETQRSQTSIGSVSRTGNLSEGEYIDLSSPRRVLTPSLPILPASPKPGSPRFHQKIKKVPVSSRVELLMSNDLFRKHLKREDLLRKHAYTYRKYGLQKSVSNLDLSDAFLYYDNTTEGEDTNTTDAEDELSKSHDISAHRRRDSRRHSLTESDPALEQFQNHFKNLKDDILPKALPNGNLKARQPVPTFKEFRGGSGKTRKILPSFSEYRNKKQPVSHPCAVEDSVKADGSSDRHQELSSHSPKLELDPIAESESKGSVERLADTGEVPGNTIEPVVGKTRHRDQVVKLSANSKSDTSDRNVILKQATATSKQVVSLHSNLTVEDLDSGTGSKFSPQTGIRHVLSESVASETLKTPINSGNNSSLLQEKVMKSTTVPHSDNESLESSHELSVADQTVHETGQGLLSNSSFSKLKERRRKGSKRPRSLISKKSSLVELINGSQNSKEPEKGKLDISERPRLRRGHSCRRMPRSKSEIRFTDGGSDLRLVLPKDGNGVNTPTVIITESAKNPESSGHIETSLKRINSDPTAGGNKNFTYDVVGDLRTVSHSGMMEKSSETRITDWDTDSQHSQDIGESDTTTSIAGSNVSESLYSEISKAEDRLALTEDDAFTAEAHMSPTDEIDLKFQVPVFRSTSDACDATPDAARKRRERKDRPYKSDPFSGTEIIPASKRYSIKEERAKLRQYRNLVSATDEILSFLDDGSHGDLHQGDSFPSLEELNEDDEQNINDATSENGTKARNPSNVSTTSTDSGVIGQEWSHGSQQSSPSNTLQQGQTTWKDWDSQQGSRRQITSSASCSDITPNLMRDCADCGLRFEPQTSPAICARCRQRAVERRKIIQEIYDTEVSYGRDLNILKQEFSIPMGKVGLLTKHQLDCIFLNLDELIHVNTHFESKLKSAINTAQQNNDEDMKEIRVGSLFLESSTMFLTFENYCVSQSQAPILLEHLEREKELLRIFLHVSQNDNQLLRRMHLKSFLMVPVQRIMKYPLLLDRLYKMTPLHHRDKDAIREAKDKINDILGHINAKSKVAHQKQQKFPDKHYSMTEKIEVSRVAIQTLGWNHKDVCDVITSHLQITQPVDHMWAAKKCKNLKFTAVHGVLLTLGEPFVESDQNRNLMFMRPSTVRSAAVVLIREKNGRYQAFRDPFLLEKCVVSQDPDYLDVFEILEWNKESLLLKAESPSETSLWVNHLKQQMMNLGCWRRRRNALPNIHLSHIT